MLTDLNLFIAFGAGFLSFISPCVLPLYPAFLSYITGMSVKELSKENGMMQKRSLLHTLFFLLGFSLVFIAIGFSTSWFYEFFVTYQNPIRQIGAILIVFFGLMIVGLLTPGFMMRERRYEFKTRPEGYIGSSLIGLAFAAGWTPCMGPILVAVSTLAASNPGSGMIYMISYFLGFAIPFFALSFFLGRLTWIKRNSRKIMNFGGWVMISMGILLFFDGLTYIIQILSPLFGDFQGF
ncbi:cytochrome c biogenesis CcdA family protein [Jeotgalibacillus proteolyticus]|uniref:Cytochrome C biogenesis protein CcdA n=1 Tax=Jeotgalibacillus proteolyticus TaxID=2082395 RepID=A0A2S5GG61_9BACL|nr:cytochrome c biogenesis protein CcdA [Jeotgalibacillus proteolyticus]PPA71958.1 cytochrome C biogenesis protein CcdA [Jeotgalibacillus proteolyticus]